MKGGMVALVTLACVSFGAGVGFILLFLCIRQLREGPGQLILGQCIAQSVLDLHWLSLQAIWPHKQGDLSCQIVGFFSYTGFVLTCSYSACIGIAVSRHFDRRKYPSNLRYHICVISLSLTLGVVLSVSHGVGSSALSTCFIHKGSWAE